MNGNEMVVVDEELETTENVEQTTEETEVIEPSENKEEKLYTQAELEEKIRSNVARNTAKIHKEYERKYGDLENVLRAGTGQEKVEDITEGLRKYYESKGVTIPAQNNLSSRDVQILAQNDANIIIESGLDDVIDETNRLSSIGYDKMSAREKAMFGILAQHRKMAERNKELEHLGVTSDVYNSKEFTDFARKFDANTPVKEIYEIYNSTKPKKEISNIGSLKNPPAKDNAVKDFYTYEESLKFTKEDMDKNPELWKALQNSMAKWGK